MKEHIDKLNRLSESHGALQPGKGMASGVIALMLAALCFLGVLAFHLPEYLTTPALKKSYHVDVMRVPVPHGFLKQFVFPFVWKG
jgi:hypothetical protein